MTHKYRNPWHKPHTTDYGPEFFTTDTKPVAYRGFQIFQRFKNSWELVYGGVCLTQRAGRNGPRHLADALLGDESPDCEFNVARARTIAGAHGLTFEKEAA